MRFTNENGEVMNLADNLTLHELLDMGVSISVSEETDPDQQNLAGGAGSGELSHHSASSPPLSGGLFCGCFPLSGMIRWPFPDFLPFCLMVAAASH